MIIYTQLHARVTLSTHICIKENGDLKKKKCFLITGGLVLMVNSSDMCHQKKRKEQNLKVGADTTVMPGRLISPIAQMLSSCL